MLVHKHHALTFYYWRNIKPILVCLHYSKRCSVVPWVCVDFIIIIFNHMLEYITNKTFINKRYSCTINGSS